MLRQLPGRLKDVSKVLQRKNHSSRQELSVPLWLERLSTLETDQLLKKKPNLQASRLLRVKARVLAVVAHRSQLRA